MASHVIVAVFDHYGEAQSAVGDLESAGVRASDMSILANNADNRYGSYPAYTAETSRAGEAAGAGAAVGAVLVGGAGLLAGVGALAIPGIGPVVGAGALVTTLAGAGVGAAAGGIVGSLIGTGIPRPDADLYVEGIRRGGTFLAVRADDAACDRVVDILERRLPVDVAERAAGWRRDGWAGFEATGEPIPGVPALPVAEGTPMPTGLGALPDGTDVRGTEAETWRHAPAGGANPADERARVRRYPLAG